VEGGLEDSRPIEGPMRPPPPAPAEEAASSPLARALAARPRGR
jgi:hypothetical protein